MDNFRLQLTCLEGGVCLMGVGNTELGDDGLGVQLAERLAGDGVPNVVVAGTSPECFLGCGANAQAAHIVFLDAVDFGGAPGSVVFLNAREMENRFPQISTHKLSLGLLAKCVEANGRTHAWLLGVQPESLRPSHELSSTVKRTVDVLEHWISDHFVTSAEI
jgi:hydrogenase 3 maturation protease